MMNPDKYPWDLLLGALRDTLDADARHTFEAWTAAPENRRFYDNLTRVWNEIQQRAASYEPDRDRLWEQLEQRIGSAEAPRTAASEHPLHTTETAHPAAPERLFHIPEAPRQVPKRRLPHLLRTAAAVAAAVAATLLIARTDLFRPAVPHAEQRLCAFEGKSQARLSDGSTVWLHGGSTLTYDTRFGTASRDVRLTGEGFFDVAKDARCPFTVEVEGLKVRVHGTRFNIRTSGNGVSVALVEGSVALDAGNGSQQMLRPGQIARYDPASRRLTVERGDVAMESCWAAGRLAFDRQPLGEICRYMARWYDTEIHISPALARNYAYTFTVTDEPLEEILRIMSRINPIVYTFSENKSVTISELE